MEDSEGIGAQRGGLSQSEITEVLALVNRADRDLLDYDVGLDSRAATNIVAHRFGPDGIVESADDDPFDTLVELDAIPYVGATALAKLDAYAKQNPPGLVLVSGAILAALKVANTASFTVLDVYVGLDVRAAENMVARRNGPDGALGTADDDPFGSWPELDAVPYVGKAAFNKLVAFSQDPPPMPPMPEVGCLLISESVEAWGSYNKAIELYNCGTSDLDLSDYGVCLVRNDDTSCSLTGKLTGGTLAAGEVHTTCRKATAPAASIDPMVLIRDNCDQELPGVMSFSGDDRIVVFYDADADGKFTDGDKVTDALGLIAQRPPSEFWKNKVLRRCNLTPFDGVTGNEYNYWDFFISLSSGSAHDFGSPPTDTCP